MSHNRVYLCGRCCAARRDRSWESVSVSQGPLGGRVVGEVGGARQYKGSDGPAGSVRPVMATPYVAAAGLALACYSNALFGDFVHDDVVAVTRNPDVLGTSGIAQLLTDDFWGTALSDPRSHKSYRPLTTLSFRYN